MQITSFKFKPAFLACLLIFLLAATLYLETLHYPFILDDEILVKKNYLIKDWKLIPNIFQVDLTVSVQKEGNFFRPVQTLSYLLDHQIWKLNVFGFHLTSIILFIINGLLVFWLVFIISRDIFLAAVTGLFFTSHPIYCESVTYISGRAELLMGVFVLLSFIYFIKFPIEGSLPKRINWNLFSIWFFILALFSKELAVILPLIFMLYDFSFNRRKSDNKGNLITRHGHFLVLVLAYVLLRLTILKFSSVPHKTAAFSLVQRLLIILANFNIYLGILFFPFGLHMSRAYLIPGNFGNLLVICGMISWVAIIGSLIWAYKNNRFIFFWGGWSILWFIPQSGAFPINSFLAEHFIYFPAIGCFAIIAYLIRKHLSFKLSLAAVTGLVLMFSYGTFIHNQDWKDEETFYKKILSFNSGAWYPHVNLGNHYVHNGFFDLAEKEYRTALEMQPTMLIVHADLALVYLDKNDLDNSILEIGRSLGVDNILDSNAQTKFPAKEEYKKIIRQDWNLVNMYNGLGVLFSQYKLLDYARLAFNMALYLAPDYPDAHWNLGSLYWQVGDYKSARKEWELTLKLDPGNPLVQAWLNKARAIK